MPPAPAIVIELPAVLTAMVGVIAALLAFIGFFLHRELRANDQAHKDLRGDIQRLDVAVKQLLSAVGRIEGALGVLIGRRREDA